MGGSKIVYINPQRIPIPFSFKLFFESTILPQDQPQFGEKLNEWAGCQNDQKETDLQRFKGWFQRYDKILSFISF